MLKRTITSLLLLFICQFSFAQVDELLGIEPNLHDELGGNVLRTDDLATSLAKYSTAFRSKYGAQVGTCNSEECKIEEYFGVLAQEAWYKESYNEDHTRSFAIMKAFFQEELVYFKEQGVDLMSTVKTPYNVKKGRKLFFSLYEAVASGLSAGVFSHASLAVAKAILDEGIALGTNVGVKGKLGSDFGDHLMMRFLGLVDDPGVDSTPMVPEAKVFQLAFDKSFFTQFEWKGRSLHATIAELAADNALFLMKDLEVIGYDLSKADCAKCKGMNSLMVMGMSYYSSAFGETTDNQEEILMATLEKYASSLNDQDAKGNSALHYAAIHASDWYFEALLKAGIDTSLKNKKGQDVETMLKSMIKFPPKPTKYEKEWGISNIDGVAYMAMLKVLQESR